MQTLYRTECRTESVPVTRWVSETVNETRTYTVCVPQQKVVKQPVCRIVCEPITMTRRCYRPVPITKNVERTVYETQCSNEIVNKVITRMVPQCINEMVPVTQFHPVCEYQTCYITQRIPTTTMVPVVTCAHTCGHQCGGGCGQCGGATYCVQYRPVTTCVDQQVAVTRPVVRQVPETIMVPRQRTTFTPVQETVQVCQLKVDRIPHKFVQTVCTVEMQPYDVTVTEIVPKRVTDWVETTVCVMVPEQRSVVVPVVRCRPVTDTVTRQVPVCVPYQVPCTVMTTQVRPVTHQVPVTQCVMVPVAVTAIPTPQAGH
jgi:hypothetical protein